MILTLDPSIADFGWAVGSLESLEDSGHFRTYSRWELERRVKEIHDNIQDLADDWAVDLIIYEEPESFRYGHGTRGIQTFFRMGMAFGAFLVIEDMEFQAVTPREWKGQQSKEETKLLVEKKYGIEDPNNNRADAIGLYDYWVNQVA